MNAKNKGIIRVLVVEDSPTTSLAIKRILDSDHEIAVVGIAENGQEALKLTKKLKPDLITMDVNLPLIDGLEVTKQIMGTQPTPILILSSIVFNQSDKVFKAISYGALDVLSKDGLVSKNRTGRAGELLKKIKFLSRVKVITHPLSLLPKKITEEINDSSPLIRVEEYPERIVAIVGSTGGPKALSCILSTLPKSFPCGIVVVIHLASGFVGNFVQWLQGTCLLRVKVAEQGEPIHAGIVYIAPANFHMRVSQDHTLHLGNEASRNGLKPCGDSLLESAAKHYGKDCIGVILSGMGKDGAMGISAVKANGGKTIAQDRATSAIFGMPKVAIETEVIDKILSQDSISKEVIRFLNNGKKC